MYTTYSHKGHLLLHCFCWISEVAKFCIAKNKRLVNASHKICIQNIEVCGSPKHLSYMYGRRKDKTILNNKQKNHCFFAKEGK